jgi:hypothetical protein
MTHLPYVAASYTLGVLIPLALGFDAWMRGRLAQRRLAAIDPRRRQPGPP